MSEDIFGNACDLLESALKGSARRAIIDELQNLTRLRSAMRSNVFKTSSGVINLEKIVKRLDSQTQQDGFHVLTDWDGKAEKFNKEIIPVDVLNYVINSDRAQTTTGATLAILLDYYFVYLLALMSLRIWDAPDPNNAIDRLQQLLDELQSPNGSGHMFADDPGTLMFIATSHFESDESAYDLLLRRIQSLDESHRARIALTDAAILGSHLRFGFDAQYARDLAYMRKDNAADYPWLCISLAALMRQYTCDPQLRIVESILNGLTPDTRGFIGKAPASLAAWEKDHVEFRERFHKHKSALLADFEKLRPSAANYSPLSFNFNFPHNLLKAIVVDAIDRGEPSKVSMNALLTGLSQPEELKSARAALIERLLGYARLSPDIIRGRPMPIITYDPYAGVRAFTKTMNIIKEG